MPTVAIRLAKLEDAQAIATVHVKTWQFAYRGQVPDQYLDGLSVEQRTIRWQEMLAGLQAQQQIFVAEVDSKIVGHCVVGRSRDADADETTGELYAIYVHPASMNQGIGFALLQTGQAYLVEQGFVSATLWVLGPNQHALRFYERNGWAADGTTRTSEYGGALVPVVRYAIRTLKE